MKRDNMCAENKQQLKEYMRNNNKNRYHNHIVFVKRWLWFMILRFVLWLLTKLSNNTIVVCSEDIQDTLFWSYIKMG